MTYKFFFVCTSLQFNFNLRAKISKKNWMWYKKGSEHRTKILKQRQKKVLNQRSRKEWFLMYVFECSANFLFFYLMNVTECFSIVGGTLIIFQTLRAYFIRIFRFFSYVFVVSECIWWLLFTVSPLKWYFLLFILTLLYFGHRIFN